MDILIGLIDWMDGIRRTYFLFDYSLPLLLSTLLLLMITFENESNYEIGYYFSRWIQIQRRRQSYFQTSSKHQTPLSLPLEIL